VLRSVSTFVWSRALPLLALPGCLVSFNDYPLGDPEAAPASESSSDHGGASTAGASVLPSAGSASGGTIAVATGHAGSQDSTIGGATAVGSNPLMIDDFEDGDAAILVRQGRSGSWYAANDGQGIQTPRGGLPLTPTLLEPARGTSLHGARTFGGPFTGWGALIGTTFASSGNSGAAYDVSARQGLRFWVRSGGTFSNPAKLVRLALRTPGTVTGGGCTVCEDHFGTEIPLTAQWVQVQVPFSALRQSGYGRPLLPRPDLKQALGLELLFPANVAFDLWVDDVELY
jgi:hypothetical protein